MTHQEELERHRRAARGAVPIESVLIVEPLPAYRRGLALAFAERGFLVEETASLDAAAEMPDVVAFTVDDDEDWGALPALTRTRAVVIALLEDATAGSFRRALRLGLAGAVPRDAPPEEIVSVAHAALDGATLLPCAIARQLARCGGMDEPVPLSDCETGWLRALAEGATVAKLAEAARYSERQMHRLIADVYRQIGADNRQQALLYAARCGILDD